MARTLTAKATKLSWILRLTNIIPPSKNTQAAKLSSFRRAIKLALFKFSEEVDKIIAVYKTDVEEFQKGIQEASVPNEKATKKEKEDSVKKIEELTKEIKKLETEADKKIKEYSDENDVDVAVKFDNEAYLYTVDLFSEVAKDLFGQYHKDAEGNIKQEAYDSNSADELFEILDSAK